MDFGLRVLDGRTDNPFIADIEAARMERAERRKPTVTVIRARRAAQPTEEHEDIEDAVIVEDVEDEAVEKADDRARLLKTLRSAQRQQTTTEKARRGLNLIVAAMRNVRHKRLPATRVRELMDEYIPVFETYEAEHPNMLHGSVIFHARPRVVDQARIKSDILSKSIGKAFKTYDRFEERVAVLLAFKPLLRDLPEGVAPSWVKIETVILK